MPTQGFRQLPSFLMANVARRSSNEAGHCVLLHVFRHVKSHHRSLAVEELRCQSLGQLRLPYARGAGKQEGARWLVSPRELGGTAQDGPRHRLHGFLLANHALLQLVLQMKEPVFLSLRKLGDWNARPSRHDFCNVVGRDGLHQQRSVHALLVLLLPLFKGSDPLLYPRNRIPFQVGDSIHVSPSFHERQLPLELLQLLLRCREVVNELPLLLVPCLERGQLILHLGQLLLGVRHTGLGGLVLLLAQSFHLDLQVLLPPLQAVDGFWLR
mmetsp:Transcript_22712/g.42767  ORF Transcript_22712/g.42767 Transcript_22712/m.42767 type:complete len:269 (+) Transcript_22712:782-1588(+)